MKIRCPHRFQSQISALTPFFKNLILRRRVYVILILKFHCMAEPCVAGIVWLLNNTGMAKRLKRLSEIRQTEPYENSAESVPVYNMLLENRNRTIQELKMTGFGILIRTSNIFLFLADVGPGSRTEVGQVGRLPLPIAGLTLFGKAEMICARFSAPQSRTTGASA
jgi:hypothetical protein